MANNKQNIPPFILKKDSKEISNPEAKNGDLILPNVDGSKAVHYLGKRLVRISKDGKVQYGSVDSCEFYIDVVDGMYPNYVVNWMEGEDKVATERMRGHLIEPLVIPD